MKTARDTPTPPPANTTPNQGPHWPEARDFLLDKLARELPRDLLYHGVHHTHDDVLPAAERLGTLAHLDDEALLLLRTAALYHDAGYIERYCDNEPIAVRIATTTLPAFGFSRSQISMISQLIMATRMPHAPDGRLAALLCDADLDSLGRADYLQTSLALWRELGAHGETLSREAWYRRQIAFLTTHTYFTPEARSLRQQGKRENLALLHRLLRDPETAKG